MSSTAIPLLVGLASGLIAGLLYFYALWFSVRGLTAAGSLRGLVLGAALRLGIVIVALSLALAAGVNGLTALAAVVGFIIARLVVTGLSRRTMTGG